MHIYRVDYCTIKSDVTLRVEMIKDLILSTNQWTCKIQITRNKLLFRVGQKQEVFENYCNDYSVLFLFCFFFTCISCFFAHMCLKNDDKIFWSQTHKNIINYDNQVDDQFKYGSRASDTFEVKD